MVSKIKKQIERRYKYRIELHAHTSPVSPCSEIDPEEMARIYCEKGYDAVVITNHFIKGLLGDISKDELLDMYLLDYEKTRRAAEKYGLRILLGAEIRFTENHNDYLVYGVDRDVLSTCYDYLEEGLEKFREKVRLERSVIVQAHPFRNGMTEVDPKLLDGYETFNLHPNHNARIGIAARYAKENNAKILTAGSDFHHPDCGHEGVTALRTAVLPENSFELAEILKSGDYVFEVGESSIVLP